MEWGVVFCIPRYGESYRTSSLSFGAVDTPWGAKGHGCEAAERCLKPVEHNEECRAKMKAKLPDVVRKRITIKSQSASAGVRRASKPGIDIN